MFHNGCYAVILYIGIVRARVVASNASLAEATSLGPAGLASIGYLPYHTGSLWKFIAPLCKKYIQNIFTSSFDFDIYEICDTVRNTLGDGY